MPAAESVRVIVRCRPMNSRENGLKCKTCVVMDAGRGSCVLTSPEDGAEKPFSFDGVYFVDSTAEQIYNQMVFPLVENVLEGYNGTVFAYGQTGSGKTFSMQGDDKVPAQRGIIPRTFEHIFEATSSSENMKFLVHASYLEIYNEEVRDLLGKDIKSKLDIKEHPEKGVYVAGLSMHAVHNVRECEDLMGLGFKNRHVGATLMNADSSRSHSIFSVHIEMMETRDDGEHIRTGKLHLVDLAGSERQAKTGATGDRLKEANKINLSLSALGNVISALVDGKSKHIPYRDSRLTRLLQDSLGGNTKTLMLACISPADNNYDETLSTLRYANRAKNIKNKPKVNEDPKDALLREYQEEINRLQSMLQNGGSLPAGAGGGGGLASEAVEAEKKALREEFDREMAALKAEYTQEKTSNAALQEEMKKLKSSYDSAVSKVDGGVKAPNSSPTHGGAPAMNTQDAIKRLERLQGAVVGGEEAGNKALKDKRQRRRAEAERRQQILAQALAKVDADDPMMQVYNTAQDKLAAATRSLDKERKKVKSLEHEIGDLQSEFELDRIDYLDTIRRQDQQLKLMQQILEKVQPTLRRDSNYANLEKIKKEAVWDEDQQKWLLPDLSLSRTQLPNAGGAGGMQPGGRVGGGGVRAGGVSPRHTNGYSGLFPADDDQDSKLINKLKNSAAQNAANNYFKGPRTTDVMGRINGTNGRSYDKSGGSSFPEQKKTWDSLMSGDVIYTNDLYERGSAPTAGSQGLLASKKPQRLEALAHSPTKAHKKALF